MTIDIVYILVVIGVILISMTLHEAMHAFVSYWLGDDTARLMGRLSLNPIKHIDPFLTIILPISLALISAPIFGGAKPVPFNPRNVRWGDWGAALVSLVGPVTNLVLAFLSFGVWVIIGTPTEGLIYVIIYTSVMVNLGFFIFNSLPIPPLDGSRVLYAIAPEFVRRGMEAMEKYGIVLVFAIILIAGPYIGTLMASGINFFIDIFSRIFVL